MKKAVILGCENSHANTFLNFVSEGKYPEIEIIGVYSDDIEAAEKLKATYGVKVMSSYDEAVGKVDGIMITARHGDNHYKYAAPYISGTPVMFIDKPITISESEAVKFMGEVRSAGVRITGGSCCKHTAEIQNLKNEHINNENGKTIGGFVRAPISLENPYGNFFFYSQHLVDMVLETYGHYPDSVQAFRNGDKITVVFRYDDYDITALFVNGNYQYYAARCAENGITAGSVDVSEPCFRTEFEEFYNLLLGEEQKVLYKDFISPVFVMNAISRSLESGKEEKVTKYEI